MESMIKRTKKPIHSVQSKSQKDFSIKKVKNPLYKQPIDVVFKELMKRHDKLWKNLASL